MKLHTNIIILLLMVIGQELNAQSFPVKINFIGDPDITEEFNSNEVKVSLDSIKGKKTSSIDEAKIFIPSGNDSGIYFFCTVYGRKNKFRLVFNGCLFYTSDSLLPAKIRLEKGYKGTNQIAISYICGHLKSVVISELVPIKEKNTDAVIFQSCDTIKTKN